MQAGLVDHRMTFREVFTTRFSEARARQRMERIK